MEQIQWWFFGFVAAVIVVFAPILHYMNKVIANQRKPDKWIHIQL